jgi:hypothetical protein
VEISVTANGSQVFNGPVSTLDQPLPTPLQWPLDQSEILFSIEVPVEFQGTVPMEITVNSGSGIAFMSEFANYVPIPNPVYTPEQFAIITGPNPGQQGLDIMTSLANPPFTQEEIDILSNPDSPSAECDALLAAHNVSIDVSSGAQGFEVNFYTGDGTTEVVDSRTNVSLNGIPLVADRLPGFMGDWSWCVPVDSTLAFTLNIDAGLL